MHLGPAQKRKVQNMVPIYGPCDQKHAMAFLKCLFISEKKMKEGHLLGYPKVDCNWLPGVALLLLLT